MKKGRSIHVAVLLDQNREEWWHLNMMQTWAKKFKRPITTNIVVSVCGGYVGDAIEELLAAIAASNVSPRLITMIFSPIHGSKTDGVMLWSKTTTQLHSSTKAADYEETYIQRLLPPFAKAQIRRVHLHYCYSSKALDEILIQAFRRHDKQI